MKKTHKKNDEEYLSITLKYKIQRKQQQQKTYTFINMICINRLLPKIKTVLCDTKNK